MSYYVSDMYEDKSELRELNVHKKLLVYSLRSLHVIVMHAAGLGLLKANKPSKDINERVRGNHDSRATSSFSITQW